MMRMLQLLTIVALLVLACGRSSDDRAIERAVQEAVESAQLGCIEIRKNLVLADDTQNRSPVTDNRPAFDLLVEHGKLRAESTSKRLGFGRVFREENTVPARAYSLPDEVETNDRLVCWADVTSSVRQRTEAAPKGGMLVSRVEARLDFKPQPWAATLTDEERTQLRDISRGSDFMASDTLFFAAVKMTGGWEVQIDIFGF